MSRKKPILLAVAGTRPEALKLAPLIRELRTGPSSTALEVKTCFSGQHKEILRSVLGELDVKPDVEFLPPEEDLTLSHSFARLTKHLSTAIATIRPQGVIVQGDTNTVLAGALAAFHQQIPIFHVEAGLRTDNPNLPFPEEMNRRLVTQLATHHYAPTQRAHDNLLRCGVDPACVFITGNTGIDAMHIYADRPSPAAEEILARCLPDTRKILVTLHRRENLKDVAQATEAIRELVRGDPFVEVIWILHLNGIRGHVIGDLKEEARVHLIEPQAYSSFVNLMKKADLILTDSGGVQEEAPTLGRPVLVLREDTERPEAVEAGNSLVVGCDKGRIVSTCRRLFSDEALYREMSQPRFPFGDGHASRRIADAMVKFFATSALQIVANDDALENEDDDPSAKALTVVEGSKAS